MPSLTEAQPFEIAERSVAPGQRLRFDLPGTALYTQTPLNMAVEVIHGNRPGPALLVCAAIHGDELNGVEVVRRLSAATVPENLAGTLILVPVVNLLGFQHQSRYLPDRRDLNRCFPGSNKGSMASRLAHLLFSKVVSKATHIIDLHTASSHRDNLPQVRAALDMPGVAEMARGFAAPVMLDSALVKKTLRSEAGKLGIPAITYEAGEALRLHQRGVEIGVSGVQGVMHTLGMVASVQAPSQSNVVRSSRWLRAPSAGLFLPTVGLGARVVAESTIGVVASPTDPETVALVAPNDGLVICISHLPLVHAGEALLRIAEFDQLDQVAEQVALHLQRRP